MGGAFAKPNPNVNQNFLFLFMQSCLFRLQISKGMSETLQPNLSPLTLNKLFIPLTLSSEQTEIAEEINILFSVANEVENIIEESLLHSKRLRQSILKRAFEGRLVPQDPDDEPAWKLLERIKKEKEKRNMKSNLNRDKRKSGRTQTELSSYVE